MPLERFTVYDYVGWLHSITARPSPAAVKSGLMARNYYVPSRALYAKWCLDISDASKEVDINAAKFSNLKTPNVPNLPPQMAKLTPQTCSVLPCGPPSAQEVAPTSSSAQPSA